MRYPDHLLRLLAVFKKFPGVGRRSAERFAFDFLEWPQDKRDELVTCLLQTKEKIHKCVECGALIEQFPCFFCEGRDCSLMCIVRSPRDIFLVDETRAYRGLFHVIRHLLSPIINQHPEEACIDQLKRRIQKNRTEEVIIALDSTLEGDATALYLKQELAPLGVTISRLALGLPMGSSLDLIDGGTLGRALTGRINLQ